MDELDQLRTDHAREMLAKGRAELEANPELGFYKIWSSRALLISMHVKNHSDVPKVDVAEFVREINGIIAAHEIPLHLEKQNDLLILALAAGDIDGASELAKITCREETSHKFDRLLSRKLRSTLTKVATADELGYRPTESEQQLFDDLVRISTSQDCGLHGVDKYWRATKTRRYNNTMFEYANLFRLAFQTLQSHIGMP